MEATCSLAVDMCNVGMVSLCTAVDATYSTYIIGLTDGVTVWAVSVGPNLVRAIQWPYSIPFEPNFAAVGLGSVSQTEYSRIVTVSAHWHTTAMPRSSMRVSLWQPDAH